MEKVTRRLFLKIAAAGAAVAALGKFGKYSLDRYTDPKEGGIIGMPAEGVKGIPVVSDVDAHSQCRMRVTVEGGKVREVRGDPTDPEGKGELTLRGEHIKEFLYAPDRLTYPMKRVGERGEGKWERISWDEALKVVAEKLKEIKQTYGAEAIDFHHGHYHSGDILGTYLPRLANLIGTPNITNPSHVCHLPRVFLQFNIDLGAVFQPDLPHTRCLLLARARGVKLIVIDPRVTSYAEEADIHAQLRPGTDGALALGMLNVIIKEGLYDKEFVEQWTVGFDKLAQHIEEYPPEKVAEITWVPAETIRKISRMYATNKPACISPRNALDQHTNASGAIRAINILMTITGNLDVKGGNIMMIPISMGCEDLKLFDKLSPKAAEKKLGADTCLLSKLSTTWPSAHTPSLWDAILHGNPYPVKAMMVMAANPALTCANSNVVQEALRKLEFLVVADLFMTPTAELADIVLPACTFLEQTRFVTYDIHADHGWNATSRLALSPKVVEPVGESWSDWKIICELGRKMGYSEYFPWKTREEAIDDELQPLGITCEELKKHPEGLIITVPPFLYTRKRGFLGRMIREIMKLVAFRSYPDMYKKYEMQGFMTPSKKVEIYSERLEKFGYDPLPIYREPAESPVSQPELAKEYPLILIAGTKLEAYTHSMMRNIPELHKHVPENLLEIHPNTSSQLEINNGDIVEVSSPRGSIQCKARVTNSIDPRVVHLYHGFRESNCNVLTDHKAFDPITGSVGMKSLLCKVIKA
ncbi:MAG: molybdopterin-dependent oxidoreductase [Deltaproteobacteria bacterium]|nr:molybdopterin-dependent oxidoreductase [Deltaproteobacteria bacterium]